MPSKFWEVVFDPFWCVQCPLPRWPGGDVSGVCEASRFKFPSRVCGVFSDDFFDVSCFPERLVSELLLPEPWSKLSVHLGSICSILIPSPDCCPGC